MTWFERGIDKSAVSFSPADRADLIRRYGIKSNTVDKLLTGGVTLNDLVDIIEMKQATALVDTNRSLKTGEQKYRVKAEASVKTMVEMYKKAGGVLEVMNAWIDEAHEQIGEKTVLDGDRLRKLLDATLIDVMNNSGGDD